MTKNAIINLITVLKRPKSSRNFETKTQMNIDNPKTEFQNLFLNLYKHKNLALAGFFVFLGIFFFQSNIKLAFAGGPEEKPMQTLTSGLSQLSAGFCYNMGYKFTVNANGYIDKLWYAGAGGSATIKVYDFNSQTVLATGTLTPAGYNTWVSVAITPLSVTSGTSYMVAAATTGPCGGGYFSYGSTDVTTNNITVNYGSYDDGSGTLFPTGYGGGTMYGTPDISYHTGTSGFTSTQSGNFNIGTTWGGACSSSCVAGTDYPSSGQGFVVANGHTVTLTGSYTVSNGTINSGGTLSLGSNTLTVSDTTTPFVVNGTFTPGTGKIEYSGTGTSIANTTYYNLKVSGSVTGSTTATVTNNLEVTGTLTPSAGTITLNNGSSLTNSGTLTFYNLTTASSATVTANVSYSVAGTLTNGTSATLTSNTGTQTFNNGSTISNGGTQLTFNNLTIASSATVTANTSYTVSGTLTVSSSATLAPTSGTITLTGTGTPLSVSGTFNPSSTNVVQYTGSTANITATTYKSLILGGTGTYTLSNSNWRLDGDLTITSGATITKGTGTITFGNSANTVTLTGNATNSDLGTVVIGDASHAKVVNLGSSVKLTSVNITSGATLSLNGSNTLTITANNVSYSQTDTYTSSNTWTAPAGVTSVDVETWGGGGGGGSWDSYNGIGGPGGGGGAYSKQTGISVTPGNGYTVTVGGGGTAGIGSDVSGGNGGDSWFSTTGTVLAKGGGGGYYSGYYSNSTAGGAAGSGVGTTKYSGGNGYATSFSDGYGGAGGGAGDSANGSNANFQNGGAGGSAGGGNGGNSALSGTCTAGSTIGGGGGGGSYAYSANGCAGARGEVRVTYTANNPSFIATGTFTCSTGTVDFSSASTTGTTIPALTYYGLTLNKASNTFTAAGAITATTLNITNGTFVAPSGNLTLNGTLTNAGTFTHNSGTVVLNNGAALSTSTSLTLNNLTVASSASTTANTSYTVAGTLTVNASGSLTSNTGTQTFNNGAVISNGGSQLTFNNMTVANSATITANTSYTVSGTLTIGTSATLAPTSGTITLAGTGTPISNSGTFTPTGSNTIKYTGSTANVSAMTFASLTLGGSGTYTMPASTTTIKGDLTVTNGATVTKGAGTVVFSGTSTQTITDSNGTKQDLGNLQDSNTMTAWCNISSSDCNSSWLSRRKITFDNSASSTNLTNFPILVSLTSSNIDYSKTQDNGQDIRFVDADGTTALSYEIEKWDESGTSLVWVNVPQIDAASTTDYIYMYYNNTSATDNQSVAATWNSGYKGVWHLKNGTTLSATDSTGINTSTYNYATATSGKIDGAANFSGSAQSINLGNSASVQTTTGTATVWVNTSDAGSGFRGLITKQGNYGLFTVDNVLYIYDWNVGGVSSGQSINSGTWRQVTFVFQAGVTNGSRIYIDGVAAGSAFTWNPSWNTTDLVLGAGSNDNITQLLSGKLDEARVSNVARSADWIKAEYLTENTAMNTFGSEDNYGVNTGVVMGSSLKATSLTVDSGKTFSVNGSNTLTLTGNTTPLSVSGTFVASTGTVDFSSASTTGTTVPGLTYYNLTVNKGSNTFTAGGNITANNFTITAGTFSAPTTMTLNGNFSNSGTFTANSGTVILAPTTPTSPVQLGGTSGITFYNLTDTTAGSILQFKNGNTYTFSNTFTATSETHRPITLVSDTPGSQWTASFGAAASFTYVAVQDGACNGGITLAQNKNLFNRGNNGSCWGFINYGSTAGASGGGAGSSGHSNGGGGNSNAPDAVFTSSSTWTAPTDVTSIAVEMWGAGGGGATNYGGGGGAYTKKNSYTVTPGNTYTVTVGAAGTANGGAGGNSWFNTSQTMFAAGGGGAIASTSHGAGGLSSDGLGDVKYSGGGGASSGGGGAAGISGNGSAGTTDGGAGGGGAAGDGGPGGGASGTAGNVIGGGGGGGSGGGSAGARGEVRIYYLTHGGGGGSSSCTTTATGTVNVSGNAIVSVTMVCNGSGYAATPTVTFSGGGGSGASGTAVLTNGSVTSVTINAGGSGYVSTPTVTFTAGSQGGGGGGASP